MNSENLKAVPTKLEQYIEKKEYLLAATELVDSVNSLFGEDLMEIGALSDLRRDLLEMKTTFHEKLIDELHDVVYLRSSNMSVRDEERESVDQDFMALILESLNVLDRIPTALSSLNNQVGLQLLAIINDVMNQIQRETNHQSPMFSSPSSSSKPQIKSKVDDAEQKRIENPFVRMLAILFPKWFMIARNHIFLTELIKNKYVAENENEELNSSQDLQSSKKRFISNPYNIDSVWRVMQLQIETLLELHLGSSLSKSKRGNEITGGGALIARKQKLFSFSNSSASTFANSQSGEMEQIGNESTDTLVGNNLAYSIGEPLIPSSPYNLPPIYPLVIQFDHKVEQLVPKSNSPSQGLTHVGIKYFIDDFVKNTFLDYIRNDYQKRLDSSIDGFEAFKLINPKKVFVDSERPLFQSSVAVFHFIEELFTDAITMPSYLKHFLDIIQTILIAYQSACKDKVNEILGESETGRRLDNSEIVQLLNTDPIWKSRGMKSFSTVPKVPLRENRNDGKKKGEIVNSEEADSDAFHEIELAIEASLFPNSYPVTSVFVAGVASATGAPMLSLEPSILHHGGEDALMNPFAINQLTLPKASLITDVSQITLLANFNNSLEWLITKLEALFNEQIPLSNLKTSLNNSNISSPSATSSFAQMEPNLIKMTKKLGEIANGCLYAIRTELRVHCYFYLNEVMRTSYYLESEVLEADQHIVELNRDLSSIEETLEPHLPKIKLRYLFYSLPPLISTVLIKSLRKIKSINKNGVLKMCRNVFALQQNLTNIVQFKESYFNKVRKYYLLLNSTEEELVAQIKNSISENRISSLEEFKTIKTILEFKAANKKTNAFEKTILSLDEFFQTVQKTKLGTTILWEGVGTLSNTINDSLMSLIKE
eukprot:TRINITY_DN5482_c5_g1_i1.p1 TRINITY_DN5482_c5_g1~~TRINITY_DN5482_c5_g1_i1.p1  ORF type:complete len:882 (+),score=250.34 TRINITY_DN5482_c5_g1_i1:1213-3858(+)